ncbi:MAG TPA: hypothetical protein VIQ74_05300 [Gemmatimonadaceae bacterium]
MTPPSVWGAMLLIAPRQRTAPVARSTATNSCCMVPKYTVLGSAAGWPSPGAGVLQSTRPSSGPVLESPQAAVISEMV